MFFKMKTKITKKTILKVVIGRAFTFKVNTELGQWENKTTISPDLTPGEREKLLDNFKAAIQIPTVSFSESSQNITALQEFDLLLRRVFPKVFSSSLVRHELVGNYSHLFTVAGSDADLEPYMLLAHIDVVPANEADGWDAPPFSAQELNGFIYGRGTIDNKQSVMGILQALEYLLEKGYTPRRSFYIGLGHDEEVNGLHGAVNIVKLLKSRGVKLLYVLDEGLAVLDGIISGLDGPAALIGISEKGQVTVKLSVITTPGHSSMPPRESWRRIQCPGFLVMVLNVIHHVKSVALLSTPQQMNVMPSNAEAYVNFRIHSAQTLQEVLNLVRWTISDERVTVKMINGFDPLPVSSYDEQSFGFQIIKKTVQGMFPQLTVAPGICVGNTDSRHYKDITRDIYRFAPSWFKPGDPQRFHGVNERISIKNYEEIVLFYFLLIQRNDNRKLPDPHVSQHEL
ncbi:hypothetical protein DNTS_027446 [Danionella cerebrum]|uniref:Peptidase M20 dimerisation domain-containing protein n=1 Tax=Danionella cerebrum TaxID=2873325 RepID=A0A553Q4A8_9TELE|nr:hypothetical protein DNTS_027446 [Danionella translucida]